MIGFYSFVDQELVPILVKYVFYSIFMAYINHVCKLAMMRPLAISLDIENDLGLRIALGDLSRKGVKTLVHRAWLDLCYWASLRDWKKSLRARQHFAALLDSLK